MGSCVPTHFEQLVPLMLRFEILLVLLANTHLCLPQSGSGYTIAGAKSKAVFG